MSRFHQARNVMVLSDRFFGSVQTRDPNYVTFLNKYTHKKLKSFSVADGLAK